MAELKPCPFCGGKPFIYISGNKSCGFRADIICGKCHCQTDRLPEEKAIEAWNRRYEEPQGELEFDYGAGG